MDSHENQVLEFKDRLSRARKAAGYTQESLGEALRVHKFTVSKWEMGKSRPGKPSDWELLGQTLNISVPYLRDGEGEPGPYTPSTPALSDRRRRAMRAAGQAIPAAGTDWALVGELAHQLMGLSHNLTADQLGRALGLAYPLARRGAWDAEIALQVLASIR